MEAIDAVVAFSFLGSVDVSAKAGDRENETKRISSVCRNLWSHGPHPLFFHFTQLRHCGFYRPLDIPTIIHHDRSSATLPHTAVAFLLPQQVVIFHFCPSRKQL